MNIRQSDSPILGRLTAADSGGMTVGCRDKRPVGLQLGSLVWAEVDSQDIVYAVVTGISWVGDGLANHVAEMEEVDPVLHEEIDQRSGGPMVVCKFVGYCVDGEIIQIQPPRPPAALHGIYPCSTEQIYQATSRVGYLRLLVLPNADYSVADVLARHLAYVYPAQKKINPEWINDALAEIVALLREDEGLLRAVTCALTEIIET